MSWSSRAALMESNAALLERVEPELATVLEPVCGRRTSYHARSPEDDNGRLSEIRAVGILMRPLGGILIGHVGDIYGRRPLILSIVLMAVPTTMIAFLLTYQAIGIFAPILVTLLRALLVLKLTCLAAAASDARAL